MNSGHDLKITNPFFVGDWHVDPNAGRVQKPGSEVKLEPKVMQVLVYLAQHPGNVISRETLEAQAWAGTIVGYDAVSSSIIKLRKALGDNSRDPQYIETISKKGYRLIAPVATAREESNTPAKLDTMPNDVLSSSTSSTNIFTVNRTVAALGIAVLFGILIFTVLKSRPTQQPVSNPAMPSVVVLPFKNLSDDIQQEYLSDGITEDLITDLSRMNNLRVIAKQSSYHYKQYPASLAEIARQLQVTYIIEGSLRKTADKIRINVQLTDTAKGENIWAQRFDTDTNHLFTVQDTITQDLTKAMLIKTSGENSKSIDPRGTSNFAAYDAFLLGQKDISARTRQGYEQAMKAFRRAIEIDPNYARVYGAMAVNITRGYRYQWSDLALIEARERALELANKAVQLNQSSPQIYWSLGYVYLHRHEYDKAQTAANRSVDLSPNYADGYALLANIANWRGKPSDAVSYIKKAVDLNPHYSFQYPSTLGSALYYLGRYQEAIKTLKESLISNENALNPRLFLAATYVRLGQLDDATWEIEQVKTNHPEALLSNLDTTLPFENDTYRKPLLDDLRKAGLPE